MKQGVKTFLHVLGGMALGGGVATAVTYKLTAKKFMKISDDRVKSLEDYIEKLQTERLTRELNYSQESELENGSEGGSGNNENEVASTASDPYHEELKPYREVKDDGTVYTKYSKIYNDARVKSAVDERYEQIAAEMEHPLEDDYTEMTEAEKEYEKANKDGQYWSDKLNSNSPPHIIEYGDFGKTGYLEEMTLYYYTEDDTLVTEDDKIIPSPEDILGDCLEVSGFKTNTQKDLYVRNYRRGTDYEISKVFQRYSNKDIS